MNLQGRKTIEYNGRKYFINKLRSLTKDIDTAHLFTEGLCTDLSTGEEFDIKDIDNVVYCKNNTLIENSDIVGYSGKNDIVGKINITENEIRKMDLENKFNNKIITIEELKELIHLKYGKDYNIYLNYENYIKINKQIPKLSDADLGKFYKILTKLTHKANTLLTKSDVRSNPLTKQDLCELLEIEIKAVEQYLKRLKVAKVIKHVEVGEKKHYMINPMYAYNGNIIGSYTYINFREEVENLSDIPEELKKLWDYEFVNSTIDNSI